MRSAIVRISLRYSLLLCRIGNIGPVTAQTEKRDGGGRDGPLIDKSKPLL